MWILECDGDIFEGKRLWLRPGKKYLFGRTKPEGARSYGFVIGNKTVSRKHLTLAVSSVKPGDGTLVESRSRLTLEDEKTKTGTEINGNRVYGERTVLEGDEHVFYLGRYEHLFRITWQPVNLSFTFSSKETKNGKDPLTLYRAQLEDLDIKTMVNYLVEKTTHVVAGKRNTAKCLQALINGKHIVDTSYVSAIVEATTSGDLSEEESLSLLEQDYDKNWPKEQDYLPPASKDGDRPMDLFRPDFLRKNIFDGYVFIMCDQRQFETLQAPITNGAGKVLHCPTESGKTTAAEIATFVKNASRNVNVGGENGKAILIGFGGEKGHEDWASDVQLETSRILGQGLVAQSEFLDAILLNNPRKLCRFSTSDGHQHLDIGQSQTLDSKTSTNIVVSSYKANSCS